MSFSSITAVIPTACDKTPEHHWSLGDAVNWPLTWLPNCNYSVTSGNHRISIIWTVTDEEKRRPGKCHSHRQNVIIKGWGKEWKWKWYLFDPEILSPIRRRIARLQNDEEIKGSSIWGVEEKKSALQFDVSMIIWCKGGGIWRWRYI